MDDEVTDGSTYGRTTLNQVTGAGRGYNALDSNSRMVSQLKGRPLTAVGALTASGGLSQSGTSKTINVAARTLQLGSNSVNYNSGSVTHTDAYGLHCVYADDPTFAGGAVAYQVTISQLVLVANDNRIAFGSITTAVGGGSSQR